MKVKLVVIGGKKAGMEIPISKPEYLIGRGDDCHLRPQNNLVSRRHCAILVDDGLVSLEDCGSANGTLVNGEKVQRRRVLKNSDHIKIGTLELEVRVVADELGEKQRLTPNGQNAVRSPVASAVPCNVDANLLGWIDGKSSGQGRSVATVSVVTHNPQEARIPANIPITSATQGRKNGAASTLKAVTQGRDGNLSASISLPQPLPCNGNNGLRLAGSEAAPTLCLNNHQNKAEWDGTDLLLLAALGILLVVVLSWLFPMSWPDDSVAGQGWRRFTWPLRNWWSIWWLRWGTVAILVTALMKLLCVRARSK